MRLTQLLADLEGKRVRGDPRGVRVRGVTCHSTDVAPGHVFVCIRGLEHDGHRFVADALARGAAALVVDMDAAARQPFPGDIVIEVKDTRRAYALLCAAWADYPARRLHVTGVTGTNGKTTTALLLDGIYRQAGLKTGLISTVFSRIGAETAAQSLTTPEAGTLQSLLARMGSAGVDRAVVEMSSHALHMQRVAGTVLQTAVLTNLTRDHLDYHGDWRGYREAKARIFSLLAPGQGAAVVNVDDAAGRYFAQRLPSAAVVTYSMKRRADVKGALTPPSRVRRGSGGRVHLRLEASGDAVEVPLPPPGPANAYNGLAAAAAAWTQGIPLTTVAEGLAATPLPPGRFQEIAAGQPFRVYVDFAHNPTALAHALRAARTHLQGQLHVVFGCKGDDGDQWKRRLMGRIAARFADRIVVTTDNPFNECPQRIAATVAAGVAEAGFPLTSLSIVLDRAHAIRHALAGAECDDAVLIAGRGHEQIQRFGSRTVPLDDATVAAEWLAGQFGGSAHNARRETL